MKTNAKATIILRITGSAIADRFRRCDERISEAIYVSHGYGLLRFARNDASRPLTAPATFGLP